MRARLHLGFVITAMWLFPACANTGAVPTGPSAMSFGPVAPSAPAVVARNLPSLSGRWRASGTTMFHNVETGNVLSRGGCTGSFTITAQDDGRFSGPLLTEGGGWNSDRFCTASGTFTGELAEGDEVVVRARLEGNFQTWPRPSVTPSCEQMAAGDGMWSGSATGDAIRLEVRDRLRCAANLDGGVAGIPMANFERTVTLVFQRW